MFKKIIVYSTCLSIIGCQAIENPLANVSSNAISSSGCAEKPIVSLSGKDVETVALNESTITKSGQVSASKNIGYTFTATTGQKLSYSTDADICIWVFTPDNEILKGGELSKNGKYIIQVAAPQGAKTFDLKMSLGLLETASSTPTESPTNNPENTSENNNSQSSLENDNLQPENDISQEQALELVQKWYAAKPRIFAPPFDRDLLNELATGKLYQRVGGEGGSIDWLQKYNRYYTYNKSAITNIMGFSSSGSRPYIKVRVVEELYLQGEKGIDKTNSGEYKIDYIYFFTKENGTWKIYNNENI
ncbi:ARC6/PARC6 family protein [Dolichospermum sp. ST_con]|nr:ARC6/PARC6 family protein [Dolichospermum sp. ST_con]MDD1420123.1 ARC6/PARC6 family protein [Dolichospermum sp. ST_sed1]MDD1425764.1 ARC6/PARC6 family protein [Dolichospermum sp. ST_sed9]MDD1432309.1 ARC6/PARC6 family protein [Dolichospermum sp. ST_sed6]MDD1435625.1 ARC6/PARC6 family protein [Dolichospermum sp. ST_sed10]MDD1441118.1 ARC6/PARC6 family protein [Dolichospermum sp. ST_sed3]MDD1446723.1 ARC6/PARC6 family protein [Dolichospermum sp. ST_sed8]MDD1455563.1 ARC6/PARC6 family protei